MSGVSDPEFVNPRMLMDSSKTLTGIYGLPYLKKKVELNL
jgi:hypothetical protein